MKRIMIKLIEFYQKYISAYLGKNCIYTPTCSEYTKEAINEYGSFKGSIMTIWRILRCNPFVKGGFDPVPPKKYKVIEYKKQN